MKTDPTTTKPGAASEPPARGGVPSKIDKVQTDEDLTRVASDDVRTLKIADISVAPDLRLRDQTNAGIASGYAKLLQAGTIFPPILVYKINGKHVLVDGHHRVDAHRQAGFDKISATIVIGDMATAFAAAVKANAAHGLRFTNADKKRAVCLALTQFPTHPDRGNMLRQRPLRQPSPARIRCERFAGENWTG